MTTPNVHITIGTTSLPSSFATVGTANQKGTSMTLIGAISLLTLSLLGGVFYFMNTSKQSVQGKIARNQKSDLPDHVNPLNATNLNGNAQQGTDQIPSTKTSTPTKILNPHSVSSSLTILVSPPPANKTPSLHLGFPSPNDVSDPRSTRNKRRSGRFSLSPRNRPADQISQTSNHTALPQIQNYEALITSTAQSYINEYLGKPLNDDTNQTFLGLLGRPLNEVETQAIQTKADNWYVDLISLVSSIEAESFFNTHAGNNLQHNQLQILNSMLPKEMTQEEIDLIQVPLNDNLSEQQEEIYTTLMIKIERYFYLKFLYNKTPEKSLIIAHESEQPSDDRVS